MKNAPLPWKCAEQSPAFDAIVDANGNSLFDYTIDDDGLHFDPEVVRRIVACVNTLENVSTEWLETQNVIVCLGSPIKDRFLELEKQRDELLARIDVVCEAQIVSSNYDRIRGERLFAVDDLEYDLFAAGWKAAIAAVRGAA